MGAWLFVNRGWLPVPFLLGMLITGPSCWSGLGLVVLGEAVRLWAVGHIGLPSRTRDDSVGPLVHTGPYGRVRNPLYVGNILIWAGFGVICWPWVWALVPIAWLYYDRIVRWEEGNLSERLGAPYLAYLQAVPRWVPRLRAAPGGWDPARAFRSERSTFYALGVSLGAMALRGWALPG